MKIGILREYKSPEDIRVALTPSQCAELVNEHKDLQIVVEPYPKRCFADSDYESAGISLQTDLSDCDVLIGVKEVPKDRLIEGKVYFFFSHTIKKQAYNLPLMRTMLSKKISMIDHETLTDENGMRLIGFGRWAGIVGAHYALLMLGKKQGLYNLKPASKCANMDAMLAQYKNIAIPNCKIALTGSGRVGKGSEEVLQFAGIKKVSPDEFLNQEFDKAVYCVLEVEDLYIMENGLALDREAFFSDPTIAKNGFSPFTQVADILINGMYWDFRAANLFERNEIASNDFKINIISDITCDVEGSVPITLRQTAIESPYIGISKESGKEVEPFGAKTIDVMAVGNLPNELPKDASTDFGTAMKNKVIPELFNINDSRLLQNAMICKNGHLMPNFNYLTDWVNS